MNSPVTIPGGMDGEGITRRDRLAIYKLILLENHHMTNNQRLTALLRVGVFSYWSSWAPFLSEFPRSEVYLSLLTTSFSHFEKLSGRYSISNCLRQSVFCTGQGYQTTLGRWPAEDGIGVDLSGGEWQKIALARMYMRKADLMLFDGPTAALDAQSEYDVYSQFVDLIAGKTSILSFSSVRMPDTIPVLDNGEIIEYGSHDELISLNGDYARSCYSQAEKYRN